MAPARRQSNGRSPLVNKQSQITSFFNKPPASADSSVPSPPLKEIHREENPSPSPGRSASPTTPSPLQPKRKKPLLVIPTGEYRPVAVKSWGLEVLGKRVRVYWPLDEAWYEGCVKEYNEESGRHVVVYDDGEVEAVELAKEKVEWVEEGKRRLKRLRRGGGGGFGMKDVGVDDCVVEEDVAKEEGNGDDDEDEDWGIGKAVEEDSDDDCDEGEFADDDEDSNVVVGKANRRSRSRKRKVEEVNAEDSGRKKKCSSISRTEGNIEVPALKLNINDGNKLKGSSG